MNATELAYPQRCLAVVMPVYNESSTVEDVIEKVLKQPEVSELIVVDDASTDGTWSILQNVVAKHVLFTESAQNSQFHSNQKMCSKPVDCESCDPPLIKIFRHDSNKGKGAALRTGIAHATAPILIIQDADYEYNPKEYPVLTGPIRDGRADVVLGSRFLGSEARRVLYFWHAVGNRLLTLLSNALTNLNLTDMETCYKAFRRELIQDIEIEENRFGFEPEVVAKLARRNLRIYEVAISYAGRTYAEGKKIYWRDGISAIRCVFKYGLRARQ